ncbi:MAG: GGDEF domain-containing response regulator [bacterium]
MPGNEKILIIDDEVGNLLMLKVRLEHENFEVLTADDPYDGLQLALEKHPDLILLDVNMPGIDGFEVCRRLKMNFETSQIPVIMLTCMDDTDYKIEGLEGAGADDYLIKDEIDHREIAARIRSILRRTRNQISVNPLTHLPGNRAIQDEIEKRIASGEDFIVAYIDIDNFKAYNDVYGFQNGDGVILLIAQIMREASGGRPGVFLGHIGGDDFVFISSPEVAEPIADRIVRTVAQVAPEYYTTEHRNAGCIRGMDRDGNPKRFPFFAVSIALINGKGETSVTEIAEKAGQIKKKLKNLGGNRYGSPEILG